MVQVGPRPGADEAIALAPAPPAPEPEYRSEPRQRQRYTLELPFDPEYLPYLGLMLVGLALRLYDLGAKAFHHDESLHAFYAWRLYAGQGYVHDPMMHGPLLFELNALAFLIFGDSDFTARLVPALLGTVLIGLPYFLRREIGRYGAIAASALFVISPAFLYFSRFLRHDIYVDVFSLLMVIGVFRYLASGYRPWFYTAVVSAALLFATKEDVYISGFIAFSFLVGCWFLLRGEPGALFRSRVRALGWEAWGVGVLTFLVINLLLYTTFFTNLRGVCTAFVTLPFQGCSGAEGALNYWFDQQDYARGGQPWFYYLMLLPLYEFVPLVLSVLSLFFVRNKGLFYWFCVWWAVAALGIYSWAGEKMPWMLPQITLPFVLLSGRLLGQWAEAGWGRAALKPRGLAVAGLVLVGLFGLLAWIGLGATAPASPVDEQSATLQRLALSVLIAAIAGGLMYLGPRWGRRTLLPGLGLGLLAIGLAGYLRVALQVTYDHPDTPSEPLIYVQSSPDVPFIVNEIQRISQQTGQGKNMPILLDNGWGDAEHEAVSWPFEWYLRNYPNRRYFTKTIDSSINLADYPVVLVRSTNLDPIANQLTGYTSQEYKLNWWFPEDYKQVETDGPGVTIAGHKIELPGLRLDAIASTLSVPANRASLLKFLIYRVAPDEMGAREMYFFVSKSVPSVGPAPTAAGATNAAPLTSNDQAPAVAAPPLKPAAVQSQADGSLVYGKATDGSSVLSDPKNAAYGPDGRLYVVDGKDNRVVVFNSDGTIATSWGAKGTGDGQFQEPWGVAVAPNGNVYVSDTWNHRVQYFDPSGKFLGKWGQLGDAKGSATDSPSVFWGPRAIAISPRGEVYVTDTGNKRVQVFGLDGSFKRMFGGAGSKPGQFNEPVGLALDSAGNVWVADAWNDRVQELDEQGKPLAQFTAPAGWTSQSVTNKPFLTVDGQGQIVLTSPDAGQIVIYSTDGTQRSTIQLGSGGSAVGVTVAPDGRLVVADARGSSVVSEPAPTS